MPVVLMYSKETLSFGKALKLAYKMPRYLMHAARLAAYIDDLDNFPGEDLDRAPRRAETIEDIKTMMQEECLSLDDYAHEIPGAVAAMQELLKVTIDPEPGDDICSVTKGQDEWCWKMKFGDDSYFGSICAAFIYSGMAEIVGITRIESSQSPREGCNPLPHFMKGEKFCNKPLSDVMKEVNKYIPLVVAVAQEFGDREFVQEWSQTQTRKLKVPKENTCKMDVELL